MILKRTACLAFAAVCLMPIATMPTQAQMAGIEGSAPGYNGPQRSTSQIDQGNVAPSASARRNVTQSRHYDRSLETNRKFRQARMRKECGPITDPELRQSCLASFNRDEPYTGSSTPRRGHRSQSGR